jgi:hypothetical protein
MPERNMLRGLIFSIPSGQEVATVFKNTDLPVKVHSNAELGLDKPELSGLRGQAPLFYYILKESELGARPGQHIGPVGSRIVAEVFYGLLSGIAGNYLTDQPDWMPTLPQASGEVTANFTMVDLLTDAGA